MELIRRGLEGLAANLMIDKDWSVWEERSFAWVGHRLRQEFVAAGPLHDAGYTLVMLSTSIPVVRDVTLDSAKVVEVLGNLNQLGVGDALVWDASHRTILSCAGVTAHEASMDWRVSQLGAFANISLILAERRAEMLAELVQGSVAEWAHPRSGRRQVPDDMLNALEAVFLPGGPSRAISPGRMSSMTSRTVCATAPSSAPAGAHAGLPSRWPSEKMTRR
jgi:hypothetical protein